jgi:eukaryotic-like serine/threonine-protein kinase
MDKISDMLFCSPELRPDLTPEVVADFLRTRLVAASATPGVLASIHGYELLRLLGVGGMGAVFLARSVPDRRAAAEPSQVAVKLLRPGFLAKPSFHQRFIQEAARLSRLSHPNLLPVLKVSPDPTVSAAAFFFAASLRASGCPVLRTPPSYFVTPYIAAGSLAEWLARTGSFSVPLFLRIAVQLAGALRFLHANGFVHRDVKPANILVNDSGHVYLADLGLATPVTETALFAGAIRAVAGTPAYLSPALAAGEAEDTRADIYAFGAVCYEMLSGRPPYTGESPRRILAQILAEPPIALSRVAPGLPSALIRMVEGAMARQTRCRYSSMADVLADLQALKLNASEAHPLVTEENLIAPAPP